MSIRAAHNGSWVCQPNERYRSRGIFFGDNPFSFGNTIFLAQISVSSLLTCLLQCLLTPIGESSFFSQMLVAPAPAPACPCSFLSFFFFFFFLFVDFGLVSFRWALPLGRHSTVETAHFWRWCSPTRASTSAKPSPSSGA